MNHYSTPGANIPALGLGTFNLKGDTAIRMVGYALEIGYRHIDTAQFYQNEVEIGRAIKSSPVDRSEIFTTTKVWPENLSKDRFLPSVQQSLRKLKMEYVDLLLIHWPNQSVPLQESLTELQKAQELGYAKQIGVSNFNIALLQQTLDFGLQPVMNQVEYHPFLDQSKLLAFQQAHNILLTAYSPVAQGKVAQDPTVQAIAKKHGKSPFQISLAWLLQQKGVLAIPRSSKEANAKANADVFDLVLSEEDMQAIHALGSSAGRLVSPSMAPDWD